MDLFEFYQLKFIFPTSERKIFFFMFTRIYVFLFLYFKTFYNAKPLLLKVKHKFGTDTRPKYFPYQPEGV